MEENQISKIIHYGQWKIDEVNNVTIDCYVTNNKRRLMSLRGTARAMGLAGGGSQALVRNLNTKWIEPYLTDDLKAWMDDVENNNIEMVADNNNRFFIPFDAELFVDICNAYIKAQKDGIFQKLSGNQNEIADKLLKVMSAFAKTGIISLIDEITGYQEERDKNELQEILAKYIRKEFLPWAQRFPEEFYIEMFRLKRWQYKGNKKPPLVGKITNRIVYDVLPSAVLKELEQRNPIVYKNSYRKYKHHQLLTEDTGIPHLDKHVASLITLMRISDTWKEFESLFTKAFAKELDTDDLNVENN